jgi:magnesium transporter
MSGAAAAGRVQGGAPSPAAGSAVVRSVACLGRVSLERDVPASDIHEYIRDAANLVWMDVRDPGAAEISMLLEEFGFHPLALEDVAKGQNRPKVDEYKGYLFVVAYGVATAGPEPRLAEVDLFIGRNYVVSIHRGSVPSLEEARARFTRGGKMLREGVGFLVYALMDALIDAYFPILDAVQEQVERDEIEMFTRFDEERVQDLLRVERVLVAIRRVAYPLREIFHVLLRPDHPFFSPDTRVYFHDVHDHVLRILDVLDIEREMVGGALEAHLTVISNRLNVTMRKLTAITVCVALAGSVFGAWGNEPPSDPVGGHRPGASGRCRAGRSSRSRWRCIGSGGSAERRGGRTAE